GLCAGHGDHAFQAPPGSRFHSRAKREAVVRGGERDANRRPDRLHGARQWPHGFARIAGALMASWRATRRVVPPWIRAAPWRDRPFRFVILPDAHREPAERFGG